jgi:hypothetical protein
VKSADSDRVLSRLRQIRRLREDRLAADFAESRRKDEQARAALVTQLEKITVARCNLEEYVRNAFENKTYESGVSASAFVYRINDHHVGLQLHAEEARRLAKLKEDASLSTNKIQLALAKAKRSHEKLKVAHDLTWQPIDDSPHDDGM